MNPFFNHSFRVTNFCSIATIVLDDMNPIDSETIDSPSFCIESQLVEVIRV